MFKNLRTWMVLLALVTLAGSLKPTLIEKIRMQDGILMITMNSPTTYYQGKRDLAGFEYELAKSFAQQMGVKLKVVVAQNRGHLFELLKHNAAAFIASGVLIKNAQTQHLLFSNPYMHISEQLICRRGAHCASSYKGLNNKTLMLTAASHHTLTLREHQIKHPELSWQESEELDASDLLELVASGEIDYTVVSSNEYNMFKGYFPNIKVAFNLSDRSPLGWVFDAYEGKQLQEKANHFLAQHQTIKKLAKLNEKYYGHLNELDFVGARYFLRQTKRRLNRYKKKFKSAAKKYQQDWRMIAAMSYQESHWNPLARSYTGVRGMMMLTRATAEDLGVKDRLNPTQSIMGGSRYLLKLKKRLKDIAEPDRTWFALAAYNIGYLHLKDARLLTESMGGNPNNWLDVKETLPLLAQKKHHKKLQYGFARGYEAVDYVQNIRRYYDILVWHDTRNFRFPGDEKKLQISYSSTLVPPLL